jgi:hypothetical protein
MQAEMSQFYELFLRPVVTVSNIYDHHLELFFMALSCNSAQTSSREMKNFSHCQKIEIVCNTVAMFEGEFCAKSKAYLALRALDGTMVA